jgi:hypothetical protein
LGRPGCTFLNGTSAILGAPPPTAILITHSRITTLSTPAVRDGRLDETINKYEVFSFFFFFFLFFLFT